MEGGSGEFAGLSLVPGGQGGMPVIMPGGQGNGKGRSTGKQDGPRGSGGRGAGVGHSKGGEGDPDLYDKNALTPSQVKNRPTDARSIASWYYKGEQVKGRSKRKLADVVSTASEAASEAISEKQIPARYQKAVRTYFGDMEKTAGTGERK
jgi:hypothetical protein